MKYLKSALICIAAVAVLIAAYFLGGSAPVKETSGVQNSPITEEIQNKAEELPDADNAKEEEKEAFSEAEAEEEETAPPQKEEQTAQEENEVKNDEITAEPPESEKPYCTISIRCDEILKNMDSLDPEKIELVPQSGVILPETKVFFNSGENVFNILQRELKRAKIHLEFVTTPMYNSVYIEGINNLYEFDCGENSGWMYKVNGDFPKYGCSNYTVQDKDVIEWVYTCDLGRDVGGFYASEK